jgi:hypothetical protein
MKMPSPPFTFLPVPLSPVSRIPASLDAAAKAVSIRDPAIEANYQCCLLIEIGDNRVYVYQVTARSRHFRIAAVFLSFSVVGMDFILGARPM